MLAILGLFLNYNSIKRVVEMSVPSFRIWKMLLVASIRVSLFSLLSLPNLYENISGDNIPNRPQGEPPIVYQWDLAVSRIIIAAISITVGVYSLNKIRLR